MIHAGSPDLDRRSFLRRVGVATLSLAGLGGAACGPESRVGRRRSGPEEGAPDDALQRPIVLPFGEDGIVVPAPAVELPVAYVSRALGRVYVAHDLRDRAALALAAHISVSTGVWRIPLPGDPVRRPIQPGDAAREFEEYPLRSWDPGSAPAEGDARLRLGRLEVVGIELACEAVQGTDEWCRGGPWNVRRCAPGGDQLCREILAEVGTASLWRDGRCADGPRQVRCLTWTAALD